MAGVVEHVGWTHGSRHLQAYRLLPWWQRTGKLSVLMITVLIAASGLAFLAGIVSLVWRGCAAAVQATTARRRVKSE